MLSPPLFCPPCNDFPLFLVMHPFLPMFFPIPLAQHLVQALPIGWLSLITLLTNHLPISYQALSHLCLQGHSPSCIYTAAKGCKEVSASPSIKQPHSLSLTLYKLPLCLWTCRSLCAGLKLHYCCLLDIPCIWSFLQAQAQLGCLSTPFHHCPSHSWSRNHPLVSLLLYHCCYTPITNLSLLFNPRTLPNHCGRLKRSQYHPQSHPFPIKSPSLPSCTLPEGVQYIPLWRLNTRTAEEYHHSLFVVLWCWLLVVLTSSLT